MDTIPPSEISKIIEKNHTLKTPEELVNLLYDIRDGIENSLKLNPEIRTKRLLLRNKMTINFNDLILIAVLSQQSNTDGTNIADSTLNLWKLIIADRSIKFSFQPAIGLLKDLVPFLEHINKDDRFVKHFLACYGEFTENGKQIICNYLSKYTVVPERFFPRDSTKVNLNKNTLDQFLANYVFDRLIKYPEPIFYRIIEDLPRGKETTLRNLMKNHSGEEFHINVSALRIIFKEKVTYKEIKNLFNYVCSKCIKSIKMDLSDINYIDDYRFLLFDIPAEIVFESNDKFQKKTQSEKLVEECVFNQSCGNKVDTYKYLLLSNLEMPELLMISLNRKKEFDSSDLLLIRKIDILYDCNLEYVFKKKVSKLTKNCENIESGDALEYENQNNLMGPCNKSADMIFEYNTLIKNQNMFEILKISTSNEFLRFLADIDSLSVADRKILLKNITKADIISDSKQNKCAFHGFIPFILQDIFFDELDIPTFLAYTDLSVIPKYIAKLGVSNTFIEKLFKHINQNTNKYAYSNVLEIAIECLQSGKKQSILLFNDRIKLIPSINVKLLHIQRSEVLELNKRIKYEKFSNILTYVKKILDSDFIEEQDLCKIEELCIIILDDIESIPDSHKLEMLLELIYEKVKVKSRHVGMKVRVKNVKQ